MAFSGVAAENQFGYYMGETISNLTANQPAWYAQAILLPGNVQTCYGDDAELTGLTFAVGRVTNATEAIIFVTDDIDDAPYYTQTVEFSPNGFNTVQFETPVKLEGKDFCVGYMVKAGSAQDAPIAMDNCGYDFPGSYLAIANSAEDIHTQWYIPTGWGNCMINAVITTPGEVTDFVYPFVPVMKNYAKVGEDMNAKALIRNFGSVDVTSLGVTAKVGDEEAQELSFDVEAVAAGAFATVPVPGLIGNTLAEEVNVNFNFDKVNGAPNRYAPATLERTVEILENCYPRVCVIEEGTGTNCGFCPRGYVAMETMNEDYKDGSFIGIAAHTYDSRDPMYCATYQPIARYIYGTSYPCATVNRNGQIDPNVEACRSGYRDVTDNYSNLNISIEKVYYTDKEYQGIGVKCLVNSLVDIAENNYGIALVTTENEVGPYGQANYYAGNRYGYGPMGGFESMPSTVSLMFNDVARTIVDWSGNTDVLPESLVANEAVLSGEQQVSVTNVNKLENAFVVALLIDKSTGKVENAARVSLPAATPENVDTSAVGTIAAEQEAPVYYTLDGMRVNDATLAPGLYIKRQGNKAEKILVK